MNHALLRFKDVIFERNPAYIEMTGEKRLGEDFIPYGEAQIRELGKTAKIIKSSGSFSGEDKLARCAALQRAFEEKGEGVLFISDMPPTRAFLSSLKLSEKSGSADIFYELVFCEVPRREPECTELSYKYAVCGEGENLWHIGNRCNVKVEALLALNPQIFDPWDVSEGSEVRIK